jgi:hypothetical protein
MFLHQQDYTVSHRRRLQSELMTYFIIVHMSTIFFMLKQSTAMKNLEKTCLRWNCTLGECMQKDAIKYVLPLKCVITLFQRIPTYTIQ